MASEKSTCAHVQDDVCMYVCVRERESVCTFVRVEEESQKEGGKQRKRDSDCLKWQDGQQDGTNRADEIHKRSANQIPLLLSPRASHLLVHICVVSLYISCPGCCVMSLSASRKKRKAFALSKRPLPWYIAFATAAMLCCGAGNRRVTPARFSCLCVQCCLSSSRSN